MPNSEGRSEWELKTLEARLALAKLVSGLNVRGSKLDTNQSIIVGGENKSIYPSPLPSPTGGEGTSSLTSPPLMGGDKGEGEFMPKSGEISKGDDIFEHRAS